MSNALRADVSGGRLTLRLGEAELLRATGEALLGDGRVLSTARDELAYAVEHVGGGVVVRLRFRNTQSAPVAVEQLRPLVARDALRSAPLAALRIYQTGWQSWSRAHPSAPFAPNTHTAAPPIRGPYLPHRRDDSEIVPWMTIVSDASTSLLLGFLSAREQLGTIELAPTETRLIAATELDGVHLAPGAELRSEPLLLAVGDEPDLLERYARAVAQHMHPRPQSHVLTGWCSWYQLYTRVSEADVDRNLASLSAEHARAPLELIQLDDGYQREVGDWLTLNQKFPSGMPALVARIKARGYLPGLWLAPFLLSARSRTLAEHPDWVVRDAHGAPLNAIDNWGAANYAVDTTHPDVLAWLAHVTETVCREWGFEYLKLDFLYAAAMRGQRYERDATGVAAYRRGLETMRRVAGDRFILGCGAPLLPSIGLVDGMRIGSDVAAYWGGEGNADGPSLRNATRATLARLWVHGKWWTNDPDCVVIRATDTELSPAEVQAWMSSVALSGGMVFVGDDFSRVESERLDLLARLIPPSAQAASALPPLHESIPERLLLRVGNRAVVGLANWSAAVAPATLRLAEFGLHGGHHVADLWSGAYLGQTSDSLDLGPLEPHGMRLLALHPDVHRPQVVASTGHVLGDVMDLASEHWDPVGRVLTLTPTSSGPPARPGEFIVHDPDGPLRRVAFTVSGGPIEVHFA